MQSNELTVAREYQKDKKWDKAIEYYEKYITNNHNIDSSVYVSYARCLKVKGNSKKAEEILKQGESEYPENKNILTAFLRFYDHAGKWSKAEATVKELIKLDPFNEEYYFELGRVYSYMSQYKNAEEVYKKGLTQRHNLSFGEIIKKIECSITSNVEEVESRYQMAAGRNNLGTIIHKHHDEKYITKITRNRRGDRRERLFYHKIVNQFSALTKIVPTYISSHSLDNLQYLTINWIEKSSDDYSVQEVIRVSQQISKVTYNKMFHDFPNPNYAYVLKSRPNYVTPFFTQIHKEYYNRKLFRLILQMADEKEYLNSTKPLLHHLKKLIMDNQLYQFIDPEKHYSLIHSDFTQGNMILDNKSNYLKVYDWASFKIGPHFIDLARYFQSTSTPYHIIQEEYLFNENLERKLSVIEQIFFLYAYILYDYVILNENNKNSRITSYIYPALVDIEALIAEFKEQPVVYSSVIIELLLNSDRNKLKINSQLKKRNETLNKEKLHLKYKLKDIQTSKSWKLTAPLRKLMQWRQK